MYRLLLFFAILCLLTACAEQRPLEGGPKDTRPPQIDSSKYSTPQGSLNFKDSEIILTFDEWIVLKEASTQILISPPPQRNPDVKIKRKSVVLRFKEELKANTTYTINFGQAIQDYNEGNPAENFNFVFSTGPYLDSLKLKGRVLDVKTDKPLAKALVLLYDELSDSTPALQRPYYATKTNEQGEFELNYLKNDSFQLFVLTDENNNYRYDLPNERIGFLDQAFLLRDSMPEVLIRVFEPDIPLQIRDKRLIQPGKASLKFSEIVPPPQVQWLQPPSNTKQNLKIEHLGDSTVIWFRGNFQQDSVQLSLQTKTLNDTLKFDLYEWPKFLETKAQVDWYISGREGKLTPSSKQGQILRLPLNQPLDSFNNQNCSIQREDSSQTPIPWLQWALDSSQRYFEIRIPDTLHGRFKIIVPPNSCLGFYGLPNKDTLQRPVEWRKLEDYGNLKALIKNTQSQTPYLLQLLDGQNTVLNEIKLQGDTLYQHDFPNLATGNYQLRLVHDLNNNGRWDSGSFIPRKQPEQLSLSKTISIRANWDNEMELDLQPPNNKFKGQNQANQDKTEPE